MSSTPSSDPSDGPVFPAGVLAQLFEQAPTFMALLRPLPEGACTMKDSTRKAFELRGPHSDDALGETLLAHRAMMYERHLGLPLSL